MNSTLTIESASACELRGAAYAFRVRGLNGVRTSAIIWPTSLTPGLVSGVVEWQDPISMSSIVSTEGDSSAWLQRLFLVYAAAGPTSIRYVPELAAQTWATFWATFPDPDGRAQDQVRISLNSARWDATFFSTTARRLTVRLPISAELRDKDAGSVLLQMAPRLARQHSSPSEQQGQRST